MDKLRIVLDANVVVSALIRPDSIPGRILSAAIEAAHIQAIVSAPVLSEWAAVLAYPRLRKYLKMDKNDIETFIIMFEQVADPVTILHTSVQALCRDAADQIYIQTAVEGRADFIISGDSDLLDMGVVDLIRIITPAEFARIMKT